MYAIETKNLTKKFSNFTAVQNLELKVPQGSIYGFLGPNGAGKTTTIKMLTGLSKPTEGLIKIQSEQVSFGSLKNRMDIGYLPDVPSFYDWMTPAQFLTFCGELFSIDKNKLKSRVEELLHLVGLSTDKKKIKGFSRGMKQRLGIAQALINEPKVVILDEPTSALDPIGRKEVIDIIMKLSGKLTVFFSTHILSDVERICDKVVILHKGKMLVEDNIKDLKKKYSRDSLLIEVAGKEKASDFVTILAKQKWADNASLNDDEKVKVLVNDIDMAQNYITKLLYENNIPLKCFETMEPNLEDIFLKVVNQE